MNKVQITRQLIILAFSGQTHCREALIYDIQIRGVSPRSVLHTAFFPYRLPM